MAAMPILRYLLRIVVFELGFLCPLPAQCAHMGAPHIIRVLFATVARVQSGWSSTKTVWLGGSAPFTAIIKLGQEVIPRVFNTSDAPWVDHSATK